MAERSEVDLEPFVQTACKAIRYASACAYAAGWTAGYNDGKAAEREALWQHYGEHAQNDPVS